MGSVTTSQASSISLSGRSWRRRITIPATTTTLGSTVRSLCQAVGFPAGMPVLSFSILAKLADGTTRGAFTISNGQLTSKADMKPSAIVIADITTHGEHVGAGQQYDALDIGDFESAVRSLDTNAVFAVIKVLF